MAQVIISMEEYKTAEKRLSAVSDLKEFLKGMTVFSDTVDCWNTVSWRDVIRPFTIEETKALVKMILELRFLFYLSVGWFSKQKNKDYQK